MKILFVADGRSPTALNWITYFIQTGDEVHLVSSYPCEPPSGLASFQVIPLAFSQSQGEGMPAGSSSLLKKIIPVGLRTRLRQWIGPMTLPKAAEQLRIVMNEVKPELVHAMRIPYEGMVAAFAFDAQSGMRDVARKVPLVISVWGNDFTLHARSTKRMASNTRRTLSQVDGLHTDCQRDQRLALEWGLDSQKPAIVLPGGGGIHMDVFNLEGAAVDDRLPVVINPRGVRAYVRNDTFFKAIPIVLAKTPQVRFLCPAMQGEGLADKWVRDLEVGHAVELLPRQSRQQMADRYRQAQIAVSITAHDGTPNTLLEALACGCFPIAGDLESLREWINPGENGLLIDPGDPQALAEAILHAMSNIHLRRRAAEYNIQQVCERAEYSRVMGRARGFYQTLTI